MRSTDAVRGVLDLADMARLARRGLPDDVWDYVEGGSGGELTLVANRTALERLFVTPRMFAGIEAADTSATFFGLPSTAPLAVAPMAYQQLLHPEGEVAAAGACAAAGVPYTLSMMSGLPVEKVTATGATTWFQLYWLRDRDLFASVIDRAEAAGCAALMLTIDMPRMGRRLRDLRNDFTLPPHLLPAHLPPPGGPIMIAAHTASAFRPDVGWADLAWLRARTRLPLLVKGILDADDASRAADEGVDAIVVSNHGGRQFDGAPATIDALPAVVRTVAHRCQVLVDSGFRSGLDIVKALAAGASGVLIGRPALWGLAAGGIDGATIVLRLLQEELAAAMLLAGCASTVDVARLRLTGTAA
jgi:4-hydroxymandelate oxidase